MLLMTQLKADTPIPVVWLWMFIAGLGVGPTFAVFTLVVQNAVPFQYLGVATSNLTFFRQIGGSVALAIVGTVFATEFQQQLIPTVSAKLTAAGAPPQLLQGFQAGGGGFDPSQLTGTGDLGQVLLNSVPAAFRPVVQPFIGDIVAGVHEAFSLAVSQTFWIGVVGAVIAVAAALGMKELALRQQSGAQAKAEGEARADAAAASADGTRSALPTTD
jgi:hypothetical protein